jgi:vitamin B12 transporter
MTSNTPARTRQCLAVLASFAPLTLALPAAAQTAPAETVVVTASRSPQALSAVLADVSVLGPDDIARSGAGGLADLLGRLPGVEFARNGGSGATTSVYLRGSESRHTAVYVDGMRVDSQSTGGAVWEQIPLDQIERIEVLRGPAAAVYGSDAVAGVVQLFTRRGQGAARPTAALSVASHGTVQAQAGLSGSAGALDYALSATAGRSEGFDARTAAATGHNPDRDGWRRSALQGRLGWQIDAAQRVEAALLASRLRSGYDGYTATDDDQNHHRLQTASLAWQNRWNADASTRVQLGQTSSVYETQPSFYRTETTLRDVTLQHAQRLSANQLSATLERREDSLFNAATAYGAALSGQRHQDAIGLGWRRDFGAHSLQAQVRHDADSEFGGKGTGSLAWGWAFLPQWRVTASAANAFRAPTLYQRFSEYGTPGLVPETSRNTELGLRWAAAGSEASLVAWHNQVSNLINWNSGGTCASAVADPVYGGCYANVGRARLQGLTLAGRTRLGPVQLKGSLDWHDPRNVDTDKLLARRAQRMAKLGAETQRAGWTLGTEVQAASQRYDDASNSKRLGGYGLLGLYASTQLMPGLQLQARVDNLADKRYELARTYATGGREAQLSLRWALP